MSESDRTGFDLSTEQLLASALHAQLLARRRATLEHDIKNVVHGLLSGTELLAKSLTAASARITPAECLSLLQQQLGRAQTTLNRIVDEVAPLPQAPSEIDLAELVTEATHALRHQLQTFNVLVSVPQGLKVRALRTRLKDMLLLVVLDCVDRAPPRSHIAIGANRVAEQDAFQLVIEHAIDESVQSPTILDAMNPLLALEGAALELTTQAQGRRVQLSFATVEVSTPSSANTGSGVDLLFVDANPDAADSLVMLVQLEGLNAMACYETVSALATLKHRAPAAVVVDLDGSVDARSFVRTIRSLEHPPRIIGVSHSPTEPITGVDVVLRKPLDVAALRRAMI